MFKFCSRLYMQLYIECWFLRNLLFLPLAPGLTHWFIHTFIQYSDTGLSLNLLFLFSRYLSFSSAIKYYTGSSTEFVTFSVFTAIHTVWQFRWTTLFLNISLLRPQNYFLIKGIIKVTLFNEIIFRGARVKIRSSTYIIYIPKYIQTLIVGGH